LISQGQGLKSEAPKKQKLFREKSSFTLGRAMVVQLFLVLKSWVKKLKQFLKVLQTLPFRQSKISN